MSSNVQAASAATLGEAGAAGEGRQTENARRVPPGIVGATVAGNAIEFYDFTTYAFFAVYIGKTFFPSNSPLTSLLLSVAVFGVGFVTRPLGGVLIGAFADRAGRKPAMLLTIGLITAGTMGLALTPSYESIGIAAPILGADNHAIGALSVASPLSRVDDAAATAQALAVMTAAREIAARLTGEPLLPR